jgi:SAM-dependent methyltransferase
MTHSSKHYWDTLAVEWHRTKSDGLWRAHSDAVNRGLLARWLPREPIPRLLKTDLFDEAVGEGLDEYLNARADRVVCMDISHHTATTARARGAQGLLLGGDVRALPFASGAFDAVVSNSTLDHFKTWDEVISALFEIHRVLRDGGQLLLTMDNRANPVVGLRNLLPFPFLKRLKLLDYYVGRTCGPRRLQRTLAYVGFDVLEMEAVMHCPRVVAVWLARWLLKKHASPYLQAGYLSQLMGYERLAHWPTRFLTGYFVAVRAERRRAHRLDGFKNETLTPCV